MSKKRPPIGLPREWGLRRLRIWPVLLGLLICAQVGLLVHQFEHHRHVALAADGDDCALCSVAAGMALPPASGLLPVPSSVVMAAVCPLQADVVVARYAGTDFQARAPPAALPT